MYALTAEVPSPVRGDGVPATVVPYDVVSPYSNETVVLLQFAFTMPLKVAPLLDNVDGAAMVTPGQGGLATIARLWLANGPHAVATKRSPMVSNEELTVTGI